MARMIPPRYDETTTSDAERIIWPLLANHLSDEWAVIHSLPYMDDSRPRMKEGECDFLLLHPRFGMLVLEAKSGTPSYDGSVREWKFDDGTVIKDPFAQARTAMHYLVGLLNREPAWRDSGLPYGYAVAFPSARSVLGNLRPDMGMDLLILEPNLDRLQACVENLLGRFNRPPATPDLDAFEAALGVLEPTFRLAPALKPAIDLVRRDLIRLTEEQSLALDGMEGNKRLLVRGGAGTGKTLLIVAEARRLAEDGENVLVLCFNRPLGAYLRDQFAGSEERITAATFHDFCLKVLRDAGEKAPDIDSPNYWESGLPDAALAALGGYAPRYDAILVDESQDFFPDWWLLVEELLADPKASRFHIFCDQEQNLYGREEGLPFAEPEFVLRRNCRNTRPIARFCREMEGGEEDRTLATLPDGPEPVIHEVADRDAQHRAVKGVLHGLVNEQGIHPKDVVVLGCHKLVNSAFAEHRKLGNLTLMDPEEDPAPNTVLYSTVHKFKGLEADCVLLTGIGEPSNHYEEDHYRAFQYVGGSRARAVLHVFRWLK